MSDLQAKLSEFIRRLGLDDYRLDMLDQRATALSEGIRNLWTDGLGGAGVYLATFTGQVNGCGSVGYDGAQIDVKDHTSGVVLATFTADSSGVYSGSLTLVPGPTQVVDFVATPTGPDAGSYATSATLASVTLSGGANSIATITIPPGASYICACNCLVPLPKTFFFGDANGTHTLTWSGSALQGWIGSSTQAGVDVYVQSACTHAITTLNYSYALVYTCPTVPSPAGSWTFSVAFQSAVCTSVLRYSNSTGGAAVLLHANQTVSPFTCNVSGGLSFTIPTTATTAGGVFGSLATPGGGGSVTVVP